jgi:hypothetical protein
MADYTEYQSSNSAYNFSKGPKSLYYGKGDDELLGVVLNVPQTDVDDEWGGTERIAWERVVDQVSQLMVEVEDPYNSGTSGLINRVNVLLGVPGGSSGYFDTSVPTLTLGATIINGALNKINIGTSTEITQNSLSFSSSAFTINGTSSTYSIKYNTNELKFTDNLTTNRGLSLLIGGSTVFSLIKSPYTATPVLGILADTIITGTMSVSGLASLGAITSSTLNISFINSSTLHICGTSIRFFGAASTENPVFTMSSTQVGPSVNFIPGSSGLDVGSTLSKFKDIHLSGTVNADSGIFAYNRTTFLFNNGSFDTTLHICGTSIRFFGAASTEDPVFTMSSTQVGPSVNFIPGRSGLDVGSTSNKFKDIHLSGTVNSLNLIVSEQERDGGISYICGALKSASVSPITHGHFYIGGPSLGYQAIYLVDQASPGVAKRLTISGTSVIVT